MPPIPYNESEWLLRFSFSGNHEWNHMEMWNHSGIIWNSWTLTFEPTGRLRTFWENRTQNSDFRAWGEYAMFWHFIAPSISPVNHISYHVISLLCQMIYDDIYIYDDIIWYYQFFNMYIMCFTVFPSQKPLQSDRIWDDRWWSSTPQQHPPIRCASRASRVPLAEFEATAPTQAETQKLDFEDRNWSKL